VAIQCENGHIACASCCIKLRNKCPSCFWPIGYNRCRSIEKVLESVKISCPNAKYGCKEAVSYSKKSDHEKTCIYAPCSCPLSSCNFIASSKQLYIHFSRKHPTSATCFQYGSMFSVTLKINDKFIVLKEQNDSVLFVLNNSVEIFGNLVRVYCIGPCSSTGGFPYTLLAKIHGSSLQLQSFTKNRQHCMDKPTSTATGFLLIPSDFFCSFGQFKLEVCIQRNSSWFASPRRMDPV
jgi:E3 ubiquitin-protein ligase SIAH1